jgi:ATPase subunit of ABC transporter with duplicated ATPase domains
MIIGLVDERIKTKVDAEDIGQVISQLLKNRYEIDYLNSVKTSEEDTHFKDMTGGQKAIALLELVFRFDDEKYPILIDQPEDDLDVVGVATDLVNFIKSEKGERQIIIVSHNASLVICADTEEVLVSNSKRNTQKKYNFSYQTGAIEDSGIRDEIIKVLEGGREALKQRARKLNFSHEI